MELKKRLEEDRATQQHQHSGGWMSWLWGSQADQPKDDPAFGDALKARVVAELKKGSFALKVDPNGKATEVIDSFRAEVVQRPGNSEASIVRVKIPGAKAVWRREAEDSFFFVKFESNPLDEGVDTALTARMRHMEIIYHRGYVEAIFKFFRPPESQLESVEALLALLKLQAAQFVLGDNLQACRDALSSEKSDIHHLLERININLLVQNSIVPSAVNLARFKISQSSDVAIPNFDEGDDQKPPQMHIDAVLLVLPLSTGLFGPVGTEYNVDDYDG
ncbi:hypothetical protein BDR04DRAFT_1170285, partial [Suillus decipiens]